MIAALVPVKTLVASKTRLFPGLARDSVERLTLAMMTDVVDALQRVSGLGRIAVVTPDEAVARAAQRAGAEPLLRPDPGLNAAVEGAAAEIAGARGDGVLVVLGDVAAAAPSDLEILLQAIPARGVALAPSSDGGTSALLRIPRDAIPACFGPDSAKRHREEAARAGVPCRQIALPSLAIDVDVGDDAEEILRTTTLGPHTRATLEALGMGER